jgi:hypothetical protein
MGLFRRKNKDPFAAAAGGSGERSSGREVERAWFEDLPESELQIDTNRNVAFTEADREWLDRDPGEEIRRRKR